MPENETTVDVKWRIGIVGRDDDLFVTAAYIWQHPAVSDAGTIILKDANHKVVFQSSAGHVRFIRREEDRGDAVPAVYVPAPSGLTPAQVRELQDSLNSAASAFPGKIIALPPGSKVPQGAGAELLRQVLADTPTIEEGRARLAEHPWETGEG